MSAPWSCPVETALILFTASYDDPLREMDRFGKEVGTGEQDSRACIAHDLLSEKNDLASSHSPPRYPAHKDSCDQKK